MKTIKTVAAFFAVSLFLTFASFSIAQDYDEGAEAFRRSDFAAALKEWRPLAEQGHVKAQYNLGTMYQNGFGVIQNYAEAVKWYRKAAEQDFALAQLNLGLMYANGQGVKQNYTEAVKWYYKAAEQGDADAQNNLGLM